MKLDKDIISIDSFSRDAIRYVLSHAEKFEHTPERYCDILKGKVLATLFFEPSTRTRLSFESAMKRLGGNVIGFTDEKTSSTSKGETVADTARMVESYADIIVTRHHIEGAPRVMAESVNIPVINAGDGSNQHPTQTFLDLYTIQKAMGSLENIKIGFLGDLNYGRTVHSLVHAMTHFNPTMFCIAPPSLRLPQHIMDMLCDKGINVVETDSLEEVAHHLDILYVTRIQKERFSDPIDYEKVKDAYQVTQETLTRVKPSMRIMHPLPRVNEIAREIDATKHAIYFEQAKNGVYVRQALLALLLDKIE